MPYYQDFEMGYVDATVAMNLVPPANVTGWTIRFQQSVRPGSSGFIHKFAASGYNNVSGIRITNFAQGVMGVSLYASEMSGRDPGAYFYRIDRVDSGNVTELVQGFRVVDY